MLPCYDDITPKIVRRTDYDHEHDHWTDLLVGQVNNRGSQRTHEWAEYEVPSKKKRTEAFHKSS